MVKSRVSEKQGNRTVASQYRAYFVNYELDRVSGESFVVAVEVEAGDVQETAR